MNRKNQDHMIDAMRYAMMTPRPPKVKWHKKFLFITIAFSIGVCIIAIPVLLAMFLSYKGWL